MGLDVQIVARQQFIFYVGINWNVMRGINRVHRDDGATPYHQEALLQRIQKS
jgi:hypothetical protein